jgi:hypothetical protein
MRPMQVLMLECEAHLVLHDMQLELTRDADEPLDHLGPPPQQAAR